MNSGIIYWKDIEILSTVFNTETGYGEISIKIPFRTNDDERFFTIVDINRAIRNKLNKLGLTVIHYTVAMLYGWEDNYRWLRYEIKNIPAIEFQEYTDWCNRLKTKRKISI